jgi:hypothetical protein
MTTYVPPTATTPATESTAPASGADVASLQESAAATQLYVHAKRPEWGLAIRVREREGRRDYQFQDGLMRPIATAYEHHVVAVDRPADTTAAALHELAALTGLTLARSERATVSDRGRLITLDEQVSLFLETYPGGFEDGRWLHTIRGIGSGRRAKGHREPASAQAQQLLAADELDRLGQQLRPDEIVARALQVAESTSLVSNAQVRPVLQLDSRQQRWFAEALRDLLYGQGALELRMAKLLQVFRHSAAPLSWPAATAWLALVRPTEHVCVQLSTFSEQALWAAPTLRLPKDPEPRAYRRVLKMALAVRDELEKRDLAARDLLDVHDFIWCTLRPAARKVILAQPPPPRESQTRLAGTGNDGAAPDTGTDCP